MEESHNFYCQNKQNNMKQFIHDHYLISAVIVFLILYISLFLWAIKGSDDTDYDKY